MPQIRCEEYFYPNYHSYTAQEDLRAGPPSRNMREDGILVCQALGHGDANKRRLIRRTRRRAASICAAASQEQPSAA